MRLAGVNVSGAHRELTGAGVDAGPRKRQHPTVRKTGFTFACIMVGIAGCSGASGNGGQGFGVGGAMMCGQVAPCGGDLTGTWNITAACVTAVGTKDLESACPGLGVDVTAVSISGTETFNSDMTYTSMQTDKETISENVPGSCLNGRSCSTVESSLQQSGASASCTGSASCSCTVQKTSVDSESGTYTVSGNTVTAVSSTGMTTTSSYCVMGSILHLIVTSTMSMGTMGQAAIDEDTIGIKD